MSSIEFFRQGLFSKIFTYYKAQNDVPKHHNFGLRSFYEIMSLANFEILSSKKFEN